MALYLFAGGNVLFLAVYRVVVAAIGRRPRFFTANAQA